MELLRDIAKQNLPMTADRSVLIVESDPLQSMAIRRELCAWQLLNPVQRVGTVRGVYADRDKFSYPAVILLSAGLPNLDSTSAQAWIRASLTHRKMPIIAIGAVKHLPILEAAVRFGANAYITTPFDGREFHCICRVLRLPVVFGAPTPVA